MRREKSQFGCTHMGAVAAWQNGYRRVVVVVVAIVVIVVEDEVLAL